MSPSEEAPGYWLVTHWIRGGGAAQTETLEQPSAAAAAESFKVQFKQKVGFDWEERERLPPQAGKWAVVPPDAAERLLQQSQRLAAQQQAQREAEAMRVKQEAEARRQHGGSQPMGRHGAEDEQMQAQQQQQSKQPVGGAPKDGGLSNTPYRQLKVEDALAYLDKARASPHTV